MKLGITEAAEMRQWMMSFYTMLATSKSPSNNTDSKHHSCKWSVNGMTCLTTQCNICHLLLAIIEQHGKRFPLFKSLERQNILLLIRLLFTLPVTQYSLGENVQHLGKGEDSQESFTLPGNSSGSLKNPS